MWQKTMKTAQTVTMTTCMAMSALLSMTVCAAEAQAEDTEQVIEQRQAAFAAIDSTSRSVSRALKQDEVDWALVAEKATVLQQHSHTLPTLFPAGSREGSKTKAKAWEDATAFNGGLTAMDAGFIALYEAAKRQDTAGAKQGLAQAQSTCNGCHRQFRSRW